MSGAAVAIVNWNGGEDLLDCLASVRAQTNRAPEVLLVDNGSTDGSADAASPRFPEAKRLDLPHNPGYGGAVNAALAATSADVLVVLNPDVALDPEWLRVVADAFASDASLGVAGSKLLYPDGVTVQHAGGLLRRPLLLADHRHYGAPDPGDELEPLDVEYVSGAAIALRRVALEQIGGFDEGFFLYFEETDVCRRVRDAGWAVRYLPQARAIHRESASTGRHSAGYYHQYHRGRWRFALKHLPPGELLGETVPAERERLSSVVALDELTGLRRAFLENASSLRRGDPLLLPTAPELRPAAADALEQLALVAVGSTPVEARPGVPVEGALRAAATIAARPFRSGVPGVAAARTAWNWVSTKWYLAPILQQQNGFNVGVVETLERIEARLTALERQGDVQARWLIELDRDLTELTRRQAREEPRA